MPRKKKKTKHTVIDANLYKKKHTSHNSKKRKKVTVHIYQIKQKYKHIFIIGIISTLFLAIIWIVYVFTGPMFRLQYIEATEVGDADVVNINIVYKSLENIRGKLLFDIDETTVHDRIVSYQENIQSINMRKVFPNKIILDIIPYKTAFNISLNGKKFLLCTNGSIVPTKDYDKNVMNLWIENNLWKKRFLWYKKIYDEKTIAKIQDILIQVAQNIPNITEANYYEHERELHVVHNKKTILIFSLTKDISVKEQIKNMSILEKEIKAITNGTHVYIDLRIKNKAFLCSYENQGNCNYSLSYLYPKVEKVSTTP